MSNTFKGGMKDKALKIRWILKLSSGLDLT